VWGRHDKANRVRIAEAASQRFGWALHIIEEAADDPPMERPDEFVNAILAS
jgi:pimeloyl-ACP methyl ester carboxylesterase